MAEIEFSVMIHTPQTEAVLESVLREFEAQSGVHVNLRPLHWESARFELNKIALYHHGPDISEIGSTWVSDLTAMNALRPLTPAEISQVGRAEDFVAESWKSGQQPDDQAQWAVPWLAETFVIHYRRDLLKKAGIDEKTAFSSHASLAETVRRLQESGVAVPIELPLHLDAFSTLHVLTSWVWSAGGDFVNSSGKRVIFNQPEALAAIRAYFQLVHNLPVEARRAIRERRSSLFEQGDSAINFGTLVFYNNRDAAPQAVRENWAIAPLPGQHFVGGSNLVIWKHTRAERSVLALIQFLTSTPIQTKLALPLATLPPRLSALSTPAIYDDPALRVFAESVRTGRSYTAVPLWGLVEDRLLSMLQVIGAQAVAEEEIDLDSFIQQQVEALARRLNITLGQ